MSEKGLLLIPGRQYSFETLVEIARRRKWLIVLPAIAIAAAAAVVIQRLPNVYRSETLILVVPQRVPESYVRSTVTARIEDRLQAISQQILSRTRLEQIVTDFNLYPEERAEGELMEDIVEHMRTVDIGIGVVKGDAFRVNFASDDPRVAMRVTERLGSLFIDESLRDREILAQGTSEFLATQLDEARRELVLNENKLLEYQRTFNGELPAQMSANLQGQHNAEMALQSLGESLNRDRERRITLERQVADIVEAPEGTAASSTNAAASEGISKTVQDELQMAQQSLIALELKLKPDHPDVRRVRRNIEELKKRVEVQQLEGVITSRPTSIVVMDYAKRKRLLDARAELDNLDREIQAKLAEDQRLRSVQAMYQARIEAAPLREAELTALTRDYETLQQNYRSLLAKKEESQISANLESRQIGEQFKILDPARVPERPVSPNRPQLYLLGALAALAIGIGLAAAAEYFDRTLRTEADVRAALNLMVLATIPSIRDAASASRRLRRNLALGAGATAVIAIGVTVAWRLLS
jgi:polysaccharide chain length determinant protein (PEP-CTERM system associated)